VVTLLVLGAALLVARFSSWSAWLVYDRSAILSGQVWRMFTGHWVHFSTSHLFYDSLVLGIAGWMIETQKLPHFAWLCCLAPWFISGVLLVVEPQLQWFGGLSALATAAIVYLTLFGLREAPPWRWVCQAALLGLAAKIIFEIITGRMLFAAMNPSIEVSVGSHLAGGLCAWLCFLWSARQPQRQGVVSPSVILPR
jgi:rhomboid family GlyGly-CTERM serine protease